MTVKQYLSTLTSELQKAFRGSLSGVFLSGSASVGAFREGASDLDVLAAVEGPDRASLERVVAACAHEALPCPATKLELVVYDVSELAGPHVPPRWSLNFDTGASTHHVGFDPASEPSHWFVLDLAFAHRHAQPLFGSATIGDPGEDAVARALDEMLEWFALNEPDALPVARDRAEHWRRTGTFKPKADQALP